MMNAELTPEKPAPAVALQALIAEHGLAKVALALIGLVARPKRIARRFDNDLPDRVRRDIGLGPLPTSRQYWDLH